MPTAHACKSHASQQQKHMHASHEHIRNRVGFGCMHSKP